VVEDSWRALFAAAADRLRSSGARVVGVTGSVGKTTTKEFCAAALEPLGVLRTEGNLNTETGVPLTLMRAHAGDRVAVLEMGMSAPGEIARLAALSRPEVGVVTCVGAAHHQYLGSLEAIAQAKAELIQALPAHGTAVLNRDDARVMPMAEMTEARVLTFGREAADFTVVAQSVEVTESDARTRAVIRSPRGQTELRILGAQRGLAPDAAAALAVAHAFDVDLDEAAARIERVVLPGGRGQVRRTAGGALILDDAYNSSPESLRESLATLAELAAPRVVVLGDMLELGTIAADAHRTAGRDAARLRPRLLVAVGDHAALMIDAARAEGLPAEQALVAADPEEAAAIVRAVLTPGMTVLVKGSRGVGLDRTVSLLSEGR
jgi:UDP-N-acetylmuramoyl-tripeptide--D-alanyl-D-alanine ligase